MLKNDMIDMIGFVLPYLYISQFQELSCSICMPCKLVIVLVRGGHSDLRVLALKSAPSVYTLFSWLDQAPLDTADIFLAETSEDPHFEFLTFLSFPFNNFLPIDGAKINRFPLM